MRTWQAVQDAKLQAAGNCGHLKGASVRPELSLHSVSGFKLQQAWLCRPAIHQEWSCRCSNITGSRLHQGCTSRSSHMV